MKKLLSSLMMIFIANASFLFVTTFTWTGSTSVDWNNTSNWSVPPAMAPEVPPTATDDFVIPSSISVHYHKIY